MSFLEKSRTLKVNFYPKNSADVNAFVFWCISSGNSSCAFTKLEDEERGVGGSLLMHSRCSSAPSVVTSFGPTQVFLLFFFFKAIKSWLWPSSILSIHDINLLLPLTIHPVRTQLYTWSFLPHPQLIPFGVCWVQKNKKNWKKKREIKNPRSLFLSSIWWDAL